MSGMDVRLPESWAWSPGTRERGIVTLADANYFPGLLTLWRSVQESAPMPVACFDIGLTDEQRREAAGYADLLILPVPEIEPIRTIREAMSSAPPLAKANKRVWPLWICPVLIAHAPFRRVFWMDCDLVVLRDLATLFGFLDDGPVFTIENNAPEATPNKPALYALLPIGRPFDPNLPHVNAGVSGWDLGRDRAALDAYLYPVFRACEDERVRAAVSWHDQGALIWAIQRCGLEDRVLTDREWNLCIRHAPEPARALRWGDGFLDAARAAAPATKLLHWNGNAPPWLA